MTLPSGSRAAWIGISGQSASADQTPFTPASFEDEDPGAGAGEGVGEGAGGGVVEGAGAGVGAGAGEGTGEWAVVGTAGDDDTLVVRGTGAGEVGGEEASAAVVAGVTAADPPPPPPPHALNAAANPAAMAKADRFETETDLTDSPKAGPPVEPV